MTSSLWFLIPSPVVPRGSIISHHFPSEVVNMLFVLYCVVSIFTTLVSSSLQPLAPVFWNSYNKGQKNALFASCYLLFVYSSGKLNLFGHCDRNAINICQARDSLSLFKDYSVTLRELPFDSSAKIKSKFPISASHNYLGRIARIDKPEFTVLSLEPVLAAKHREHRGTVRIFSVHLMRFCASSAPPENPLALFLLEATPLNVI